MVALSSSLQNAEALHDPALASWEFYPLLSFRARSEFCSRNSMTAILLLAAVTVAPVAPLLLTMMPLEELLKKLLGILF
jgi:hypothetical protein